MFGKLAVLIVSAGLIACALLAARQMRTQAAYELAQSRLRAVRIDEDVARLRAEISAKVNPERVLEMAARMNPMKPLADTRPSGQAAAPSVPAMQPPTRATAQTLPARPSPTRLASNRQRRDR